MKVKALILVSSIPVMEKINSLPLKLPIAYKISKIMDEAKIAVKLVEAKRIDLAKEFGTLNEERTQYIFSSDEANKEFSSRLEELLNEEVDMDITPIDIADVKDDIVIEPGNIEYIAWFIAGL